MANTAEQMEMFGYTAEGAQQEADKYIDNDAAPAKDITFKDAAKFVAELTPVIGDAMAAKEVYDELQKDDPNYLLVGALGGAAIIGLIPGIGDAAAAAIKAGAKKSLDVGKRIEIDPDAVGTMGGNIRLAPKKTLHERWRTDIDPEVYDAFHELAMIQRGKPERAMTDLAIFGGGGVMGHAAEHIGDLTHRMAEYGGKFGSEYVKPKVDKMLKLITNEYGFRKEFLENLENNAKYFHKENKINKPFEEYKSKFIRNNLLNLEKYAEEHKKVPVYNELQLAAREAAVSLGEQRFYDVEKNLLILKDAIDNGTYAKRSIEFNPKIDFRRTKKESKKFAEGGTVMNKQMEMAFMKQGGIKDDGMTKDPVSGNTIPPGSMATEVRDNIPAMLSDGEYVVPADVLRYYGVNFFENLRGQAKEGLQTMEQNGRIGGTPMTQQDVARNMKQPVMANTGMMLEPEKQDAPQAMGNQTPGFNQPVQAFNQGTTNAGGTPNFKSNFNVATARMNTPMFQGTSSQQANIAAAQQNNPNQGAEVTVFKTHYNTNGETTQIKYVQMPGGTLQPAPGQDSELAKYPMTEAEWLAYKKGQGGGGGGGGGGGSTTPKGSSTSWMKGIDFTSEASVKAWAKDTLEFKGQEIAGLGGLLIGGPVQIKQANDIAKVRGVADMYAELNPDLAEYLNNAAKAAVDAAKGSPVIQALEMAGLMSGENYGKNEELKKRVQFGYETQQETQAITSGPGGTSDSEGPGVTVTQGGGTTPTGGGAVGDKYTFSDEGLTAAQIAEEEKITDDIFDEIDKEFEAAGVPQGGGTQSTLPSGATATSPDVDDINEQFSTTASNEGGLMTTPKPKKKKGRPKKSGLAGKK